MSQAAKATHDEKTAVPFTTPIFEFPKLGGPILDLTKVEVPEPMREAANKVAAQMQEGCAKMQAATNEASDLVASTLVKSTDGMKELHLKALDLARGNLIASMDHLQALMATRSLSQLIDVQTAYARKAWETYQSQSKEFSHVAQQVATNAVEPVKSKLSGILNKAS